MANLIDEQFIENCDTRQHYTSAQPNNEGKPTAYNCKFSRHCFPSARFTRDYLLTFITREGGRSGGILENRLLVYCSSSDSEVLWTNTTIIIIICIIANSYMCWWIENAWFEWILRIISCRKTIRHRSNSRLTSHFPVPSESIVTDLTYSIYFRFSKCESASIFCIAHGQNNGSDSK